MKLIALRLDEEEKRRLQQLAAERHITLSYALREGARLYLEEWSTKLERRDIDSEAPLRAAT